MLQVSAGTSTTESSNRSSRCFFVFSASQGFVRAVQLLRSADEHVPVVSYALAVLGSLLLAVGLWVTIFGVIWSHPSLLVVLAGYVCLIAGALAHRGGLVRFLPPWLQEQMLSKTVFDVLQEFPGVSNALRRWVRVLLLCQERSEGDIESIVNGLDPLFLEKVFRQQSVSFLPASVRFLLLPKAGEGLSLDSNVMSLDPHLLSSGLHPTCAEPGAITPAWLRTLLKRKKQEWRVASHGASDIDKAPPLAPVARVLVQTHTAEAAFSAIIRSWLRQGAHYAAIAATTGSVAWVMSALFFRTTWSHAALGAALRLALPCYRGADSVESNEVRQGCRIAAQAASSFSLLGAGGSMVLTLFLKRCCRPKITLPPTRGEVRAVVPCASREPLSPASSSGGGGGGCRTSRSSSELLVGGPPRPRPHSHSCSSAASAASSSTSLLTAATRRHLAEVGAGSPRLSRAAREPEKEVSPETSESEAECKYTPSLTKKGR